MGGVGKCREKTRILAKNCMNLKELGEFRRKISELKKFFSKIVNRGGYNKLKCLVKIPKFGNRGPLKIMIPRVTQLQNIGSAVLAMAKSSLLTMTTPHWKLQQQSMRRKIQNYFFPMRA